MDGDHGEIYDEISFSTKSEIIKKTFHLQRFPFPESIQLLIMNPCAMIYGFAGISLHVSHLNFSPTSAALIIKYPE